MNPIIALLAAIFAGAFVGLGLQVAIRSVLNRMLEKNCPGDSGITFWARFSLVMLVLTPILFSLAFGLPESEKIASSNTASVLVKIITASLFGGFLAMVGMGIWIGRIARDTRSSRS